MLTKNLGGKGDWSSKGCITADRSKTTVICKCNHLSTFGILSVSNYFFVSVYVIYVALC